MQQKLKVVHANTPQGFQRAIEELERQYEGWTIIDTSFSTDAVQGFTALVLLEERR